jgi:hypothetical protein
MTSTITELGAYDALEKAAPGEPVFPLLGRDPDAPATITEWCRLRRNRAFRRYGVAPTGADAALLAAELRQAANAEAVALEFNDWRQDVAEQDGVNSTYQDVIKSADEIAEADRRTRRERACKHLREAAYHLSEARDLLDGLGMLLPATERWTTGALARINGMAEEVTGKREPVTTGEAEIDG